MIGLRSAMVVRSMATTRSARLGAGQPKMIFESAVARHFSDMLSQPKSTASSIEHIKLSY
jgi:hypothetical protein